MRWNDIICEKQNVEGGFQTYALDLLIPLYKKGLEKVPFNQFKNQIMMNPDVSQGIDLDDKFFMDNLVKLDIVDKVEPDPDNQHMMIWFKSDKAPTHDSSEDDAAKKKEKLDTNATKQAKKAVSGKENPL